MTALDLHRVTHPEKWPRWPLLPMTRSRVDGPQCAVLVAPTGARWQLYEKNIHEFKVGALRPQLEGCPVFEYATADAVLAGGWKVD